MEKDNVDSESDELVINSRSFRRDVGSSKSEAPGTVETEYTGTLVPCSKCNLWFASESNLKHHCNEVHLRSGDVLATEIKKDIPVDINSSRNHKERLQEEVTSHPGKIKENVDQNESISVENRERTSINLLQDGTGNVNEAAAAGNQTIASITLATEIDSKIKNDATRGQDQKTSLSQRFTTGEDTQILSRMNSTNFPKCANDCKMSKQYYKCSRCTSATFASSKALTTHHIRCHRQELEHVCHNCGHHFKHKVERSKSIRNVYTQTGVDHWMCEICCKRLLSFGEIEHHKLTQHKLNSKIRGLQDRFTCVYCSKTFQFPGHLKQHEMVHTGEKPNQCPHCEKCFRLKGQLDAHINVHTKQTIYMCGECDARFYQAATLNHHLRSKHQVWKYECSFCRKRHVTKRDKLEHERIHTGEKPYICEECGMGFPRKQNLDHHLKAHRNERLFVCSECSKAFFRKSTLKEHLRTHTGEKPYQCQRCSKRFTQKSHLRAHLRSHLRQELEKPRQPVGTDGSVSSSAVKVGKAKMDTRKKQDESNRCISDSLSGNDKLQSSSSICTNETQVECVVYIQNSSTDAEERPQCKIDEGNIAIDSKLETFVVQDNDPGGTDNISTETIIFQTNQTERAEGEESVVFTDGNEEQMTVVYALQ